MMIMNLDVDSLREQCVQHEKPIDKLSNSELVLTDIDVDSLLKLRNINFINKVSTKMDQPETEKYGQRYVICQTFLSTLDESTNR